jgi:hypothetical protein
MLAAARDRWRRASRSRSMRSPTGATCRRPRRPAGRRAGRRPARGRADRHGHRAATTRWTATTAGSGSSAPIAPSSRRQGETRRATPPPPSPRRMGARRDRRVHAPTVLDGYAGMRTATGSSASTSAPTAPARSCRPRRSGLRRASTRAGAAALAACLGMVDYSDRARRLHDHGVPKQKIENTLGAWVARTGCASSGWPRPRSIPTSPSSSTAARRRPSRARTASCRRAPRSRPTTSQPEMSAAEVTAKLVAAIGGGLRPDRDELRQPRHGRPHRRPSGRDPRLRGGGPGSGRGAGGAGGGGGAMIVTADHGNCEMMIDPATGGPHTAHTTNPVPVALSAGRRGARLRDGRLADVAPTLLDLMGLEPAARDDRREPDRRDDPRGSPRAASCAVRSPAGRARGRRSAAAEAARAGRGRRRAGPGAPTGPRR